MKESLEEKNKDLKALLESSGRVAETLDPKKIAQDIVDSIPKRLRHLGYKGGIITLYDRDKKLVYAYAITELEIVKKAKKLLSKPFRKHSESVDGVSNLTIQTVKTGKIYIGGKLEEFIAPTVSKKICKLIQKLVGAKSFMSIPLFSRGKVVGAIIFVAVKPLEKIEQRDKDILYVFSSHIGSAIENARLYEKTSRQMNELSRLNENLKEANQKLEELLKIKNEFLHITSHQLRTPLTAIRGMISMWYEGDFDNLSEKERKEIIKRICISTERLNNITNDMLDALELEGGFMKFQFKPVSLERVIRETIDMLKPNYNKKNLYINLNVKSKDLPKIELEPNYIRQVFLNLIDNACKYTKKGGVDIDIKRVQKHIDVTIRDTGIGVSKSDQGKIFQKFTRGRNAIKENASGSGLGLFIAKRIVDEHQGKIEFHSAGIGKGSTVKVSLPVRQEK
jgi:signal transduction histidine kinase